MRIPTMKKTATAPLGVNELLTRVDDARDQIAALRDERAAIESAPRVLADVLTDLDLHLDRMATKAVDDLALYQLRDRRGMSGLRLSQSGHPNVETATLLGLLIATNRNAVRELVGDQLMDLEGARPGMAEADRTARLAEIDAQILTAELVEEYAIRQLAGQGVSIQRRADLSPLVALAADAALAG